MIPISAVRLNCTSSCFTSSTPLTQKQDPSFSLGAKMEVELTGILPGFVRRPGECRRTTQNPETKIVWIHVGSFDCDIVVALVHILTWFPRPSHSLSANGTRKWQRSEPAHVVLGRGFWRASGEEETCDIVSTTKFPRRRLWDLQGSNAQNQIRGQSFQDGCCGNSTWKVSTATEDRKDASEGRARSKDHMSCVSLPHPKVPEDSAFPEFVQKTLPPLLAPRHGMFVAPRVKPRPSIPVEDRCTWTRNPSQTQLLPDLASVTTNTDNSCARVPCSCSLLSKVGETHPVAMLEKTARLQRRNVQKNNKPCPSLASSQPDVVVREHVGDTFTSQVFTRSHSSVIVATDVVSHFLRPWFRPTPRSATNCGITAVMRLPKRTKKFTTRWPPTPKPTK